MKKFTHLFTLLAAFVSSIAVNAQEVVTSADQLADGDLIYIMSPLATNSDGATITDIYLRGSEGKTETLSLGNFFKVEKDDSRVKLCRLADGLYLPDSYDKSDYIASMTTSSSNAANFKIQKFTGFSLTHNKDNNYLNNTYSTDAMIRLVRQVNKTLIGWSDANSGEYLNYGDVNGQPKYYGTSFLGMSDVGTGCESVWMLYKDNAPISLIYEQDGKYYGTVYLPMETQIADDNTTAYYCTYNEETGKITLTEVPNNIIPANTGVVLVSSSNTAYVKYSATGATAAANILTGTTAKISWDEGATDWENYYVLATGDEGLGFYFPGVDYLDANRAYFNASEIPATTGALKINFDTTTGISQVEQATSNANAPIYDLSGRRVVNASKGVYIQNGHKFIIK